MERPLSSLPVKKGVRTVEIPFEISAEFVPVLSMSADQSLTRLIQGPPPSAPEFSAIVYRCETMKRIVMMARHLAVWNISVLIQGGSGTGKELFARAINEASPRHGAPYYCGQLRSHSSIAGG